MNSYRSGIKRFLSFCSQFNCTPFPLAEQTLCYFVAHLLMSCLSYNTIRLYLAAVRFAHIILGWPDPLLPSLSLLHYTLRGIRRTTPSVTRPTRLPVTPVVLLLLRKSWSSIPMNFEHTMLWAACCLGFFAFLRSGEFTCSSRAAFHDDMLSPRDIIIDSHSNPSYIQLTLRRKTDVSGRGVTIVIGRTGGPICPVVALLTYLSLRPATHGHCLYIPMVPLYPDLS